MGWSAINFLWLLFMSQSPPHLWSSFATLTSLQHICIIYAKYNIKQCHIFVLKSSRCFFISYIDCHQRVLNVCVLSRFSHAQLFATPWTVAHQAPLSMGLSRQEYWRGLPCPPPWDLPNTGIQPMSLMSSTLPSGFFASTTTWEAWYLNIAPKSYALLISFYVILK